MAISKINVGNTSHPLKDGLLHTTSDRADWEINNMFSVVDPEYDDPLTAFTAEQVENLLNREYTQALPLGITIQLPQTTFEHNGTTYTEGAKKWMYCGNINTRDMIFMRYGDSSNNLYDVEVTKPNDPSLAIARHLSSDPTSDSEYQQATAAFKAKMEYLQSAIMAQFEAFLSGHSGVAFSFKNQIQTPVAARQLTSRISNPGSGSSPQSGLQQAWYVSSSLDDTLNFTQQRYRIGLATSSNFFGHPVLSQMIAPIAPKVSGAAQNEGVSAVDAAIYQYGGSSFWAREQFPIFKSETGGNTIKYLGESYSHLIFDERRRNIKKITSGGTYQFHEDMIGLDSNLNPTIEAPKVSGNGVFAIYTTVRITEE